MDVFVSYKREEKPLARQCVDALEASGFSVWWDDDITPHHGEPHDRTRRPLRPLA